MRGALVLLAGALLLAGCGKQGETVDAASGGQDDRSADAPAIEPTAAMGEQVFKRCVACHTVDAGGSNGIGPNLHGIAGRAVASHPGFSYSSAMKAKGGVWDAATLDTFLEAPLKALPGTRMAFAGVIDPTDRAALILYLDQSSK